MPQSIVEALRYIHVLFGVGWVGEVATIVFVVIPAASSAPPEARSYLFGTVFPRLFLLASVLGGVAIAAGAALYLATFQRHGGMGSTWSSLVLGGGTLAGALYLFHLFQESRGEARLAATLARADDPAGVEAALAKLRKVPRVGLVVLAIVVGLMVAAASL